MNFDEKTTFPCYGKSVMTGHVVLFSGWNKDAESPFKDALVGKYLDQGIQDRVKNVIDDSAYLEATDEFNDFRPDSFFVCNENGEAVE